MKKFYAFFAAALMSVSVFAAKDEVPSDQVLAEFYNPGDVCMCFYVPTELACYDIVVTGSFNGWSDQLANCVAAEAIEGYEGWYVASFEAEAEPDATKGIQAKPVIKDALGAFNWDYQVGTATVIRGGMQVVAGSYEGQVDLINYGTDAPNVFTVDSWLKNPCTAVYKNYKVSVYNDGCNGYVVPFLVGAMNGWKFEQMQYDDALSTEDVTVYSLSFKAAEGTGYQVVSGLMDDEGEIAVTPSWSDDAYIQVYKDEQWQRLTGPDGKNDLLTGEETNIVFDLRPDTVRWARCDDSPLEYVVMRVNLPAENCPEIVEIIGTFDAWEGTPMEKLDNGWFFVELEAKQSQFFKFRRGVGETSDDTWATELELYDADDVWAKIADGQLTFGKLWQEDTYKGTPCKYIELDFSDPEVGRWATKEQGIENVVLTEQAQKVVVDGVIYIIRNNKMFNLQGAQVR